MLFFLEMPISPSLGGVSVPSLPRLGRITKAKKKFRKKWPKIFGQHVFFCRNILKFGNLPNAFINFDFIFGCVLAENF